MGNVAFSWRITVILQLVSKGTPPTPLLPHLATTVNTKKLWYFVSGAWRLCGTVIWLFAVSQIAAQTRPKHENPSEFTRVSNVPTRSQEQKNQKPRGSQSKLVFAWEEIFECNLHVAGSRPEATIQGFAFELWGNRDIAEHSCWGKAYLCGCLSSCRCWQEAGGGPGWDRGWWVHEGAGVYTVLCSVKPVHHFIGNHCSEKRVWMLILKLQHESERVSCHCGLKWCSDQIKVRISPIPQEVLKFWWGLTLNSVEGRIPTIHLWPLIRPVLYISGPLLSPPPLHAHWAPTFPLAHWWEGWGSHFLWGSVGISQLTLQMHTTSGE